MAVGTVGIDTFAGGQTHPGAYASGLSGAPFFDWLLRNQVIPTVIDGRNNKVPMLKMLYQRVKHVAGRGIVQPIRDGRNYAGISAIGPEGNMPDPGRQGAYSYGTFVKDIYARAKFSAKLLRMASGDASAFVDAIEFETQGLKDDLAIKQEIMLHGDGSGRRGMIAAGSAGSTFNVGHNTDNIGVATVVTATNIYLDIGMRVAFIDAAGTIRATGAAQQAFYVVAKPSTSTIQVSLTIGGAAITVATVAGLATGDWIVDASRDASMSAGTVDTAWRAEPMGLEGIMRDTGVLDGTGISVAGQQTVAGNFTVTSVTSADAGFQGVQVNAGVPTGGALLPPPPDWNKAIVATGGGALRPLTDGLIQRAISDARRINGGEVKLLVSAHQMYDAFLDQLYGDKRFNTNTLSGGHSGDGVDVGGLQWSGLSWHKSRFMLENKLFGLDPSMLSIYENEPLQVAAPPGNPMYERLHDKDSFWCAFVTSYNLMVSDVRNRTGFQLADVN